MSREGEFFDNLAKGVIRPGKGIQIDPVFVADAASYTVDADDSNRPHIMPDLTATCTLTLPSPAKGLSFEFIYGGVAADAQNWVIDTGASANYLLGGLLHIDTDAGSGGDEAVPSAPDGATEYKVTVVTPDVGTRVEVFSDGIYWYLAGTAVSASVPTFA